MRLRQTKNLKKYNKILQKKINDDYIIYVFENSSVTSVVDFCGHESTGSRFLQKKSVK